MSSSKKFGLGQLAMQNAKMQSGLSTVCNFYKNHAASASVSAMEGFRRSAKKTNTNSSSGSSNQMGRVSKLIGVKKTLVNQMQGMAQKTRPRGGKSHALLQAMSSKYNIYGPTTLFSSMSSLPGASSSCICPSLNHRRGLASIGHQEPAHYIVHQRYHQASKFQEKLNEDIARDISLSIKSELMDVDSDTKRLISCVRTKYAPQAMAATVGEEDSGGEQLEKQRHKLPRAMKAMNSINIADDLIKQNKPLRRKTANVRYKDDAHMVGNVSSQQLLSLPALKSRKLQTQWGELFSKSSVERTNSNRHSNNIDRQQLKLPQQQQQQQKKVRQRRREKLSDGHDNDDDELMSVPTSSSLKKSKSSKATAMASTTAADDIDFDGKRDLSSKRAEDADGCRMDAQHYQSNDAANLMSASQRVIHKQFEGHRKPMSDSRNKLKQVRQVQSVSPVQPPSKTTTRTHSAAPKSICHFKESLQGSTATKLWKRQKSEPLKPMDDQYLGKKLAPFWSNNSNTDDSQMPSPHVQMGEKRQECNGDEYVDLLQNDMALPSQYSKESAVQRLSTVVEKRPSAVHHLGLRARQ